MPAFRLDVPGLQGGDPLLEPHFRALKLTLKLVNQRLHPARWAHHITAGEHAQSVAELGRGRGQPLVEKNAGKEGLQKVANEAL